MQLPERVTLCDTGPTRLLYLRQFVPTDQKLNLIWALVAAGLREIEASAFVHPRQVPQLADAEAVFAELPRRTGLRYSCYVFNAAGARRALAAGADEIRWTLCLSDSLNVRLSGMTARESLAELGRAVALCRSAPAAPRLVAHLGSAFGCAWEGEGPAGRVLEFARAYRELGLAGAILTDSHGGANPAAVYRLACQVREAAPELEWGLHLTDARGFGMANLLAGLQAGITRIDGSIGGLGSVPFQPEQRGNIATEQAVALCHALGVETGIDLPGLGEAAARAQQIAARAGMPEEKRVR